MLVSLRLPIVGSRRFTEKQMAEIIRRAVEIQSGKAVAAEGISEDELRTAAAELGIEPGAISAALSSVDVSDASSRPNIWGGPTRTEIERVIEGTMTEDQWEETVADLRAALEEPGTVEQRGNTYEWSGTSGGLEYNTITVRQSGGTVRLKAVSTGAGLGTLAYALGFLPIFMVVGFLVKAGPAAPVMAASIIAAILLMFLLARQLTSAAIRRRKRVINEVFDRMQARLETGTPDMRSNLSRPTVKAGTDEEQIEQSLGPGDPSSDMP